MSPDSGPPPVDPDVRNAVKWIALILFLLYCADLAWKLAHWSHYAAGLSASSLAILLTVRLLFTAFLLWMYLRARRIKS